MSTLQTRFGIVLLIIISIVSFMVGRSLRPVMDARSQSAAVLGVSEGGTAPSPAEGDGESRI